MSANFERETTHTFEYQSKVKSIGFYKQTFKFKRMVDGLICKIAALKAEMSGGMYIADQWDSLYISALAHLHVLAEPIPAPGEVVSKTWLEDIPDTNLKLKLYSALMDYQMSFYEDGNSEPTV